MIPVLLLAAALGPGAPADFRAAFPAASIIESPAGGRLTHASGFESPGLGDTPEAAARAFLAKYGTAFGINPRQELVARGTPAPGEPGAVRFERRIGGWPVFDGDVVVGVDAKNAVILVNPGEVVRAARGWRGFGQVLRPVWRVDLVTARPPGDWRTYVDAGTGKVLFRADLRTTAATR